MGIDVGNNEDPAERRVQWVSPTLSLLIWPSRQLCGVRSVLKRNVLLSIFSLVFLSVFVLCAQAQDKKMADSLVAVSGKAISRDVLLKKIRDRNKTSEDSLDYLIRTPPSAYRWATWVRGACSSIQESNPGEDFEVPDAEPLNKNGRISSASLADCAKSIFERIPEKYRVSLGNQIYFDRLITFARFCGYDMESVYSDFVLSYSILGESRLLEDERFYCYTNRKWPKDRDLSWGVRGPVADYVFLMDQLRTREMVDAYLEFSRNIVLRRNEALKNYLAGPEGKAYLEALRMLGKREELN